MLKKFSKFLLISLLVFALASNIFTCFADNDNDNDNDAVAISDTSESNPVETSETGETSTTSAATDEEDTSHYGDLYLFDTNVVIDNIVYGNVYAIANTVKVTGQIEGNLFVLANSLTIDSSVNNNGLVGGSIYACANSIYYNGACTYLYAACNNIEMTYDSYVIRDAKISAFKANIIAAIGRDIDLSCINLDLGKEDKIPLIYGNLTYSSLTNTNIPDGIVTENSEEQIIHKSAFNYSILEIVIGFVVAIITVLALYFILNKINPNFVEKISNKRFSIINIVKSLGVGLLTTIVVIIVSALLLISTVGAKLGIILALMFIILCFVAVPVLEIVIVKSLKSVLKLEKNSMFILVLCLVSIVLYGITLIPFAGIVLNLIIKITAIGLIICNYLPNKGITDEQMAKKIKAKEDKEKRKQEKLEAKKTKKNELNG